MFQEPVGKLSAPEMVQPSTSPRPSIVDALDSPVGENPSEADIGPVVAPSETTTQNEQPTSPPGPPAPLKPVPKSNEAILLPACKLSFLKIHVLEWVHWLLGFPLMAKWFGHEVDCLCNPSMRKAFKLRP